jgi:hypothetical protein
MDHSERREEIPNTAPCCRAHPPARHHGRREHHIHSIGGSRGNNDPDGDQRVNAKPHVRRPFFKSSYSSLDLFYQFLQTRGVSRFPETLSGAIGVSLA